MNDYSSRYKKKSIESSRVDISKFWELGWVNQYRGKNKWSAAYTKSGIKESESSKEHG